jgi:hypothetical protein
VAGATVTVTATGNTIARNYFGFSVVDPGAKAVVSQNLLTANRGGYGIANFGGVVLSKGDNIISDHSLAPTSGTIGSIGGL